MFSHLSVSHSVHRGHAWQGACVTWGYAWWGHTWQEGVCVGGGHAWQGARMVGGKHGRWGYAWRGGGACMAGEMATAADSTHSTGMHSCHICQSVILFTG